MGKECIMVYNANINLLKRKMRVNWYSALLRFTTPKHVLPGHSSDQFNAQSYLIFLRRNCPFWCYEERPMYFCPCLSVYYKSDGKTLERLCIFRRRLIKWIIKICPLSVRQVWLSPRARALTRPRSLQAIVPHLTCFTLWSAAWWRWKKCWAKENYHLFCGRAMSCGVEVFVFFSTPSKQNIFAYTVNHFSNVFFTCPH